MNEVRAVNHEKRTTGVTRLKFWIEWQGSTPIVLNKEAYQAQH